MGGAIVSPQKTILGIQWNREEMDRDMALRTIRITPEASFHLVRIRTAEKPHVHDFHDGTVFVLSGKLRVRLADRTVTVGPGDVIEIPRGVLHWAENLDQSASEAYVIYTPPYDGEDRRLIPQP
jgi:mannose-6-phosphate isomerase-like protein (cupin superfamily)